MRIVSKISPNKDRQIIVIAKFLLKFIQTEEYRKVDLNLILYIPKIHNLVGKRLVKMFPFETCWERYLTTVFKFCAVCREPPFSGKASRKIMISLEVHGGE